MRAFTAVVVREISERRALLAAAAVASLLPILAPLLPATGTNPASDIREAVMWIMVGCLVPLFALLLGVSFIGRDLAEDRLGFYFAQPLSGPTIWFGKLTAVVMLVWAAEILIILPTALLSPNAFHFLAPKDLFDPFDPQWLATLLLWLGPVFVVLISHALGVVWRGRSAWLLIDLAGLVTVLGVSWWAVRPFLPMNAPDAALATGSWMSAWMFLGLILAGSAQMTCGRVDPRRGHRALSATLWSVLLVAGATALGWSHWVRAATPTDLARVKHVAVGSGDWIAVTGLSPGRLDYHSRFLFNVSDGRWVAIDPGIRWYGPNLQFSADGSLAVWPALVAVNEWTIKVADLAADPIQPRRIGVTTKGRGWDDISVSPDGSRLVVLDGSIVAAYDTTTGDQIAAAQIEGEFHPVVVSFHGEDSVQTLASTTWKSMTPLRWRRYRLDLSSKTLSEGADLDHPWRWRRDDPAPDSGWYLDRVEVNGEDRLVAVDTSTLEVAADLGPMTYWSRIHETDDGRVAIARDRDGDHHIDVFSANGDLLHRIDLDDAEQVLFGGEVESGRLVVGLWTWGSEEEQAFEGLRTSLVDLKSAEVSITLDGFAPILGPLGSASSAGAWAIGSTAGRLLRGEDGSLHLWDPETNELSQIIPVVD